eukprot:scaffold2306_cov179-Alexandrium_tamarense.AAC.17
MATLTEIHVRGWESTSWLNEDSEVDMDDSTSNSTAWMDVQISSCRKSGWQSVSVAKWWR